MRTAVYIFAFFILHRKHFCHNIFAGRLHDLHFVTDTEFVFLLKDTSAILQTFMDRAQILISFDIRVIVVDLAVMCRRSEEKSGRKLTIRTFGNLFFILRNVVDIFLRIFKIIINCLSVRP